MKFILALATILASSEAFSPTFVLPSSCSCRNLNSRDRTNLRMATRVDSADLVEEALAASKEFGSTSKEAMLAWEAVEEVDSSDNSAATMGNLNDECDVEVITPDCLEYNESLEKLQVLLEASKPNLSSLANDISDSVSQVKLAAPTGAAASNSPELQAAVVEAKRATKETGIASSAAQVAWETVEEIAASGNNNALGGALSDDECLVDAAAAACEALEELKRVISARE
mmetsp:Transcript_26102/g.26537  ORF Transcript_26102/g.26537 Transcript_26102/m.26537 type:complete len:229 (+) Transcript_26102:92-778(+)